MDTKTWGRIAAVVGALAVVVRAALMVGACVSSRATAAAFVAAVRAAHAPPPLRASWSATSLVVGGETSPERSANSRSTKSRIESRPPEGLRP